MSRLACAIACAAALMAGGAGAQETETILVARRAAQALAQAAVALQEAEGALDRVAALTQTVRAYEDGLVALREGLRRAALREQAVTARFEARREEVSRLTGVLAGIERTQGPLMLLHPSGPLDTARAGMILADVTPALQAEAEALRRELEEVARLRSVQQGALAQLAHGLTGVQEARTRLSRAIAERTDLPRRLSDDPEALAALLSGAQTLESFAAGLAAVPLAGAAEPSPAFRSLRGRLPLPVSGTVLRRYGEADAAGVSRPGLVIAAAPEAIVTAPAAATVRYAGPLLDYGNVIVLEPEADYLLILAGLGEMLAAEGDVVAAGAPLGLMGGEPPDDGTFLAEAQQGGGESPPETLYIEVREQAAPTDPEAWFAPQRG